MKIIMLLSLALSGTFAQANNCGKVEYVEGRGKKVSIKLSAYPEMIEISQPADSTIAIAAAFSKKEICFGQLMRTPIGESENSALVYRSRGFRLSRQNTN